jgi:protein-S-isoprenylcysteine O-methyltransferase Ste14
VFGLVIIARVVEFIRRDRGTPAPHDPPHELVASGLYHLVRDPQYLGVFLVAVGQALLAEAAVLLGLGSGVVFAIAYHLVFRYY